MRDLLNREKSELASKPVTVLEPIDAPGKYIFKVIDCREIDSRHLLDGTEKEVLPDYADATRELFFVLQDAVSGKVHITRTALDAFIKYKDLSEAERKSLAKFALKEDNFDGYAIIKQNGVYQRIASVEGEKEFEGLSNIFSKMTAAMGMPEGTTPSEFEEFKGRMFKGKLVVNEYSNRLGEEKSRLKLAPSFWLPSEAELQAVSESAFIGEDFK